MKMPLAWHEECLRNHERWYALKEQELQKVEASLAAALLSLQFIREQVAAAKARGLEAYDPDKFLVRREKK
jgi:hypothetical protein